MTKLIVLHQFETDDAIQYFTNWIPSKPRKAFLVTWFENEIFELFSQSDLVKQWFCILATNLLIFMSCIWLHDPYVLDDTWTLSIQSFLIMIISTHSNDSKLKTCHFKRRFYCFESIAILLRLQHFLWFGRRKPKQKINFFSPLFICVASQQMFRVSKNFEVLNAQKYYFLVFVSYFWRKIQNKNTQRRK